MSHAVTLIPGDGTGPEITEATRRVLEATGVQFIWEVHQAGLEVLEKCGTVLPDEVIESIQRTKVALKGPITTPIGKGSRSANVLLRKKLDLYANLRPAKTYQGLRSRYENIDLTIVRENTEDLYSGIEFQRGTSEHEEILATIAHTTGNQLNTDSAISIKFISVMATRRIVKFAFEYARAHGHRKVTAVHKANIMKLSDGLFLSTAQDVAKEYPDGRIGLTSSLAGGTEKTAGPTNTSRLGTSHRTQVGRLDWGHCLGDRRRPGNQIRLRARLAGTFAGRNPAVLDVIGRFCIASRRRSGLPPG